MKSFLLKLNIMSSEQCLIHGQVRVLSNSVRYTCISIYKTNTSHISQFHTYPTVDSDDK